MKFRHRLLPLSCLVIIGCAPASYPGSYGPPVGYRPLPGEERPSPATARRSRPAAPQLKRLANGHYRVRKPWLVELNGRRWLVPAGYTSNGMTAPARLKASLGDGVEHPETWSAVFHDWLFTQPGISRAQADRLFHDILLAYEVPAQKANLMHAAVSAYSLKKNFR